MLAFCFWYFRKRKIPSRLIATLILFLALILSNVIFLEILHTAKMWAFYGIIVSFMSVFFIAQQYYFYYRSEAFLPKEKYLAFMLWGSVLLFFQSIVGIFSALLFIVYAILLKHFSLREFLNYLLAKWYWIALFSITQVSFLYRQVFVNIKSGSSFGISDHTVSGQIDWVSRLWNPLLWTMQSHPLAVVLYATGSVVALVFLQKGKEELQKQKYLAIALLHPILTYLIFHFGIGFSILPRYTIMLTLALAFSSTIFITELENLLTLPAIILGGTIFAVIGIQCISLYWSPSSEKELTRLIAENYNFPDSVFIIEKPALRLSLPINGRSLSLLDDRRKNMERFKFLTQYPKLADEQVSFLPATVTVFSDQEFKKTIDDLRNNSTSIWTITTERLPCSKSETEKKECFSLNEDQLGPIPQEPNVLATFLSYKRLGYSYFVRKIY